MPEAKSRKTWRVLPGSNYFTLQAVPPEKGQLATIPRLLADLEEGMNYPKVSAILNWNGLEDTINHVRLPGVNDTWKLTGSI
jgi:hypothetical protein